MESLSEPMGIMVSESTYNELHTKYSFKKRERISVKGKGEMNAYMLDLTVLEMYDNVSSDAVTGKETIGEQ
jgi:class 3 adenylate cyclase